jgi:hypothetical protein
MAEKQDPQGIKPRPVAVGIINGENYTITCGYEDCGYTDKLSSWAVAHGNTECTWICAKCQALNVIEPWW